MLAAACLWALDHHVARLAEDHARARALAAGIRAVPGVSVVEPETNIVLVDLEDPGLERDAMLTALGSQGVRLIGFGPRRLRAVTHLDVDDAGIARAIEVFRSVAPGLPGTAGRRR